MSGTNRLNKDMLMKRFSTTMLEIHESPLFVDWEIAGTCNLKCMHCSASASKPRENELDTNEVKGIIDQLSKIGVFHISFTGGEPFIRKDFLEILRHAHRRHIHCGIYTNGTLINDSVAFTLKKANPTALVSVSILGASALSNDTLTGVPGSFDRAIMGIKFLIDNNIRCKVISVITKLNYEELPKILRLVQDLHVEGWSVTNVLPWGRADTIYEKLKLDSGERRTLVSFLRQRSEEPEQTVRILFHDEIAACSELDILPRTCPAGKSYCRLTAEGLVTFCQLTQNFKLHAGNLRRKRFVDIWRASPLFVYRRNPKNLKNKCADCEYKGLCLGGCMAAAFERFNDTMSSDPFCPFVRDVPEDWRNVFT